jgi:hypothetical protein
MNTPRSLFSALGVAAILVSGAKSTFSQSPAPTAGVVDGPARWDAALFLPTRTVNDILGKVAGTALKIPVDVLPDFQIILTKATFSSDFGSTKVTVALSAGFPEMTTIANLEAGGTFQFVEFTRGAADKDPQVKFRVALDTLQPSAQVADKKFNVADLISRLHEQHLLELISEYLVFSIPVPLDLLGEAISRITLLSRLALAT